MKNIIEFIKLTDKHLLLTITFYIMTAIVAMVYMFNGNILEAIFWLQLTLLNYMCANHRMDDINRKEE